MNTQKNGYRIFKLAWRVFGAILSGAAVISLVIHLWGSQFFVAKAEMKEFKKEVKQEYVNNKVFEMKIEPIERQVQALYDHFIVN